MGKKRSLFSYSNKKKRHIQKADKGIIKFLKAESKKGKILFISNGPEAVFANKYGFDVTVVDNDLEVIKEEKKKNQDIHYYYSDFFNFSKRISKDEFNVVFDNNFSNRLLRTKLAKFYKEIARMLKYNGNLISKVLSVNDPYCIKHCPKRHWTTINKFHLNYFDKKQINMILRKYGFIVNRAGIIKNENVFHLLNSSYKVMKL